MKMFFALALILTALNSGAQKISYSKPTKEVGYLFDIVGKVGHNYIIYKRPGTGRQKLMLYDENMRLVSNKGLGFMGLNPKVLAAINYNDHFILLFEVRKKNTIYCMAVKMNGEGARLAVPQILDTTSILSGFNFNVSFSENKEHILIYRTQVEDNTIGSSKIFSRALELRFDSKETLPHTELEYAYTLPLVDDKGSVVLSRYTVEPLHNVLQFQLGTRKLGEERVRFIEIPLHTSYTFDHRARIDIDNLHRRYVMSALCSGKSDGNTAGLFTASVESESLEALVEYNLFSDVLRATIKSGAEFNSAFNNLQLRNITLKNNGGFVVSMEDSDVKVLSKVNYQRSPKFPTEIHEHWDPRQRDFLNTNHMVSPLQNNFIKGPTQFFENSIVVAEIDSSLKLTWNSVITKNQVGKPYYLSFGNFNTGLETHYLFSGYKSENVINNYSILGNGEFKKHNTFKTLETGHTLMPKYLKQVDASKVIVPAFYRNRISFVLLDFSQPYVTEVVN